MRELIPNKKFVADLENFKKNPALNIERIANDPTAWSARVDIKYRISFEPSAFRENNAPDWTHPIKLLCILDHDDLYRSPH